MGNTTCPAVDRAPVDPVPFYSDGNLNFKAHDVGWIVCGFFSCVATAASAWLVWKHLTYYTCPQQQRHIIRMLFMVPIYAVLTTLSYIFFNESIYYTTVCDCYEAVVITSFFNLVLQYVGDTPSEQLQVFRQVELKKWFFPLNFWRYRPDGVHFLWLMKVCILQYAIIQPICTLVAVGLQYYGLYCLESWQPYFGHLWISLIVAISISVAMYCIIQIYLPITEEVKPYKPVLKFLAVKAIIFLTFWQNSFLSVLIYFGVIKQTKYFTAGDIQVGINALLVTFEMMIFGFVHIKAFTYVIYRPQDKLRKTRRGKALLDVLDFRDWWYDMRNTTRYVAARSRGNDFTIADDIRNQKHLHLEKAMGRDRMLHLASEREMEKQSMPTFWKDDAKGGAEGGPLLSDNNAQDMEASAGVVEPKGGGARPSFNYLMQDDYDVEAEEGCRDESSVLPRLPFVSYATPMIGDTVQPVRYRHIEDLENEEGTEADITRSLDIARRGGRVRKEASLGLGTWWRAYRERISGTSIDEANNFPEDGYDEKTDMLAEELRRGIDRDKGNDECRLERPPLRRGVASSEVSKSVLQGIDSPLSLFISEHGRLGHSGQDSAAMPRIMNNEGQVATVCDSSQMMARHGSTKAAVDERPAPVHCYAPSPGASPPRESRQLDTMSQSAKVSPADAPRAQNAEATVGGKPPSIPFGNAAYKSASKISITNTPQQIVPSTEATLRSSGPKGKSISLVLPPRLSRGNECPASAILRSAPNASAPSPSPSDWVPATGSKNKRSPLLTGKIKLVMSPTSYHRNLEDDPEAEPINRAGTVVAGAQSLSQVKAAKSQLEEEEKQESTLRANEQDRVVMVKGRSPRLVDDKGKKTRQSRLSSSGPATTQPYTPLPAPSQMALVDRRQDPFAAASLASASRHGTAGNVYPSQQRSGRTAKMRADGFCSLEVGSVISRQRVLDMTTLPRQHSSRPLEQQQGAYLRSSLPPGPIPLPLHHRQGQQQRQTQHRPNPGYRHSIGSTLPPAEVVLYDRHSGEPSWQTQEASGHQRPSWVASRRRMYEAPPGFHFDYLD